MKNFLFYYKASGRWIVVVQANDSGEAIMKFMDWLQETNQLVCQEKFDYTEIDVI